MRLEIGSDFCKWVEERENLLQKNGWIPVRGKKDIQKSVHNFVIDTGIRFFFCSKMCLAYNSSYQPV